MSKEAAPATVGEAMLVPLIIKKSLSYSPYGGVTMLDNREKI